MHQPSLTVEFFNGMHLLKHELDLTSQKTTAGRGSADNGHTVKMMDRFFLKMPL